MIFETLRTIRDALQAYIQEAATQSGTPLVSVVLDNVGLAQDLGGSDTNLNNQIVMSLVNIQEETSLKNIPHYRQENGRTVYKNPPVSLNLFLLISVLHSESYETALRRLSHVIEYFQTQKEFSFSATPNAGDIAREVKVYPDLYSLTFEQLNHLWGALGGKQVPFVLYKVRVIAVEAERIQGEGPPITELAVREA